MNTQTVNTLSPDRQLVLQIAKEYPGVGGTIDWKRAYTEHPEWRTQLRYGPKDTKQQKGCNLASDLRIKGLLPPIGDAPKRTSLPVKGGRRAGFTMSAETKRKIAASQRKRWTKQRAATNSTVPRQELKPNEPEMKNPFDLPEPDRQLLATLKAVVEEHRFCPKCGRDHGPELVNEAMKFLVKRRG